jgi:hypothetical protein
VNVVRTIPKDVQGDPQRVDVAVNLATKVKVVPAETGDLVVPKVVPAETGDLVVPKVVPAETGDLVVPKVVPAETGDLVVPKVVPAVIAVHRDNHRLTWAKCSTSSTRMLTVR